MQALLDELSALPPGDALFDLDGTLIHGDIGESCYLLAVTGGHRNEVTRNIPPGADAAWSFYRALPTYEAQCVLTAQALGGLTLPEIDDLVGRSFGESLCSVVPETHALVRAISPRLRPWILTGSAEVLGVAVGRMLGIEHVRGLRLAMDGPRLTTTVVPPVTCGEGKVRAAWEATGRRPSFAIGDSPHDLPLLRTARVARTCGRNAGTEFPAFP
jgi:phosphoserine phosphatase